jgi:DNA-binding PadR family transcriptional regulator
MPGKHRHRHGRGWFGFGVREEHGGPWGFRGKFFEAGEVRLALLSLLEDGPKHGYELMKEMEKRSGGTYKASAGSVYPNLQMLEDEGLVHADVRDDGKRVFAITDAGREELGRNRDAVHRIWDRADDWGDWSDMMTAGATEVIRPGMRLVRAAFRAAGRGDDTTIERVRDIINRAADDLEKLVKER